MTKNLHMHRALICQNDRQLQAGHKSAILWFTGLSGAGKSTLAHAVEKALFESGHRTFVFDGDNVRHGLCKDLGFSIDDREENIRRVGEMSKLFLEAGVIALNAFISPFQSDRIKVRKLVNPGEFIEIYCKAELAICEKRDVKGLYKKARQGEIKEFTGISSPYEAPTSPEIEINTGTESIEECVSTVLTYLRNHKIIS